ncbi:MAG TPA: MFS transporter [Pseudonocardia sp.]|jgi:EmrB/QacA subfamily drug resistance transporter|nr:MFS transporter [Pseudonocardia sp.]
MTGLRVSEPAGRWVLAATVGGSSLAMLDATVVTVALERIGRELHTDLATLQWVTNGYTLSLAALILLGGALGDRFGRRRVFVLGVVWFALASALCGLAPSAGLLVAGRVLQGVGGALLAPGSLAIIAASFSGNDRSRAIGSWSALGGLAGAIGPFVGGALVTVNWRAVFWVNIPIAIVVIAIAVRHVPESRDADAAPRLDLFGAALAVIGLGGLTAALTWIGEFGVTGTVLVSGLTGIGALIAFGVVEARSANPLVPLVLFADRLFRATNLITLLIYGAFGVFFFLLVLQLQTVAGYSPTIAGTAMLPVTALMLILSARSGALADRIGPRPQLIVGPLLAGAGFVMATRIGPGASYLLDVLPATVLLGFGLASSVAPLTASVLSAADEHHAGVASGINNAVARSAGLLALALVPSVAGLGGADYTDPAAFDVGFDRAMFIGAGLLALAAAVSALLLRPTERSGDRARRRSTQTQPQGQTSPQQPTQTPAPAPEPAPDDAEDRAAAPEGPTEPAASVKLAEYSHCGIGGPQLYPACHPDQ